MAASPAQLQPHAYYLSTRAEGQDVLEALRDVPALGCAVKRIVGAIGPDELLRVVRRLDRRAEIVHDHPLSPIHVYAVRFPWNESYELMVGYAEDLFGEGSLIEFDFGMQAGFPRMSGGEAQVLVRTDFETAARAARELRELGEIGVTIERAWPRG